MPSSTTSGLYVEFLDVAKVSDLTDILIRGVSDMARAEGRELVQLNLILTNDAWLQELNREYRGFDEPTDVLAFDLAGEGEGLEGDIYISLDRASAQAKASGELIQYEVVRLAVHGILHLCGWDHDDDVSLRSMMERGESFVQNAVTGN